MKRWKLATLVVAVIVVGALGYVLAFTHVGDRRNIRRLSGGDFNNYFWMSGELITEPVTDWSWTDSEEVIQVRTRTPYFIPHTTNTFFAYDDKRQYIFSDYFPPRPGQPDMRDRFPEERFWNRNVLRDPRVRVKIGDKLVDFRAYYLTDPAEVDAGRQAFINKYPEVKREQALPPERRPRMHVFRLEQDLPAR